MDAVSKTAATTLSIREGETMPRLTLTVNLIVRETDLLDRQAASMSHRWGEERPANGPGRVTALPAAVAARRPRQGKVHAWPRHGDRPPNQGPVQPVAHHFTAKHLSTAKSHIAPLYAIDGRHSRDANSRGVGVRVRFPRHGPTRHHGAGFTPPIAENVQEFSKSSGEVCLPKRHTLPLDARPPLTTRGAKR
jgi:hypothetical protein